MVIIIIILFLLLISLCMFFFWVAKRINKYIIGLEKYIESLEERVEFCENILTILKVRDKSIIRKNIIDEE